MPAKRETASVLNFVTNIPVKTEQPIIGSLTTGGPQPPQGQVMKLIVSKLPDAGTETTPEPEQKAPPPLFGAHIREGIAVVKDWMKKAE